MAHSVVDHVEELFSLLSSSSLRTDVRIKCAEQITGLSASDEGRDVFRRSKNCLNSLVGLCSDGDVVVRKSVVQSIVNIATDEDLAVALLSVGDLRLLNQLYESVVQADDQVTEVACMALSNLIHPMKGCEMVATKLHDVGAEGETAGFTIQKLVELTCCSRPFFNHLGSVLCNLSRNVLVRRKLVDREQNSIKRLFPMITYPDSNIRRRGVVGTIRNCCFDTESHEFLLSSEVDILTALAYPLAGPEEFDDDINEKLPLDLQYLGEDKLRELDPTIRIMLIEAMNQLCATKMGRTVVKEKNIYFILRELHKWEKDKEVLLACENLVDILIGDEPTTVDNLKDVEVPDDLQEKFKKMDEAFLND